MGPKSRPSKLKGSTVQTLKGSEGPWGKNSSKREAETLAEPRNDKSAVKSIHTLHSCKMALCSNM